VHAGKVINQRSEADALEYLRCAKVKGVGSHEEMLLPVGRL
jgi:hypothetical protein